MRIDPYLNFSGQCAEAFGFYERVLGGRIEEMMTHGASAIAADVPAAWRDRILHARLVVGDQVLMGSDTPPEYYAKPQGLCVSITVKTPADAERVFQALADKGTVTLPIATTFWSPRFGLLTDRFGTPWMVNCEQTPD
jgi:PhnB protein